MKIKEFIEKVNENERMEAEEVDGVIAIYNDSDLAVVEIPCDTTNLLEIKFVENYYLYSFGKSSREYLSALIEEFLHTPVEERFPEKKYRLRWIDDSDCSKNYIGLHRPTVNYPIIDWYITSTTDNKLNNYHELWTESELEQLKKDNPRLAPAIDAMKEEVKDDEAD
jgi:hypothetical protein